ncbi:MAG: hypothetical protein RJA98_227 [Pseudomonadota bacterium]
MDAEVRPKPALGVLCHSRFAPCPGQRTRAFARHKQSSGLFVSGLSPPPACGRLPLDLRKANAALRSLIRWWHAMETRATVVVGR